MFDDLLKTLKNLEETKIVSIPIETDEKGYIDKQCPSEKCNFIFKVYQDDWSNICKDEAIWCPFCRHQAPAENWYTIEQVEQGKSEALSMLQAKIHNAILSDAQKFNRKQSKNGFISISMNINGGKRKTQPIPIKAAEQMQLEITCEECNTRFAVIGSAYFCPACGHNSVLRTFNDSVRKIKVKLDNNDVVKKSLIDSVGKDEAEIFCRSLIESCLIDGVVAFQKYCEGNYVKYKKTPFNVFQRLEQGSNLWKELVGYSYSDWLHIEELNSLNILFQKRHILSHNEGIVDDKYLKNSNDTTYIIGQRIVISRNDIIALIEYIERLAKSIDDLLSKLNTKNLH
jgi:uncharacterized Zn finger protein (UPF0148 family)